MMISVGSRDGRKGLEHRFSSNNNSNNNKVKMDETELEEGEACSYRDEEEDVDTRSIDPDVALSYLDEKLQSVLGHFKKDFEGVVTVENLGAKYGTYGSFLPAHRRSPVGPHPRSPPRMQNHNTLQSPNTLRVEGGQHNSLIQANVPNSLKNGAASASSNAYKPPSQNDQCRQTARAQSIQSVEQCTPKSEVRDQRTLKVRIKVGSDNLSVKKNSAICSALGLDGSPSSSFDDSPMENGGLSRGLPSIAHESPALILQMMTSFPLLEGYLLSPLSDDLVQLSERPKFFQDIPQPSSKISEVKKDCEDSHFDFDFSAKGTNTDVVSCEELVSNALKLPLLSSAYNTMEDSTKASEKEKVYYDTAKRETSEKAIEKAYSAGNVKGETANSSTNTDTGGSKLKRASKSGRKDPVKQMKQKPTSSDGVGLPNKEHFSSGDKKKSKKSQVHGLAVRKVATESSSDRNLEKSSKQRDLNKAKDSYKDFFGDVNDLEADLTDSPDVPSGDRLETSEVVEKAHGNTSREQTSSLEPQKGAISGTDHKGSSHNVSLLENGRPVSDVAPAGVEGADNWVQCDKCLKWRLLPPGSKVDSLPEKWICSMQSWLPGMNKCSVIEDETTKVITARYQLVAENQNGLLGHPSSVATGLDSANILARNELNDGKMTEKVRKSSKSSFQDSPSQLPGSTKKKQQSAKDRTLSEAKEIYLETNQHKNKERRRGDRDSHEGHSKMSNGKGKREADQELPRSSKKSKMRSMKVGDNDQPIARDQDNGMLGVESGYAVGANIVMKDKMTNSEFLPSGNPKHGIDGGSLDTFGKSKSQVEKFPDVPYLHASNLCAANVAPKKRKTDNFQDPPGSTPLLEKSISDNENSSRKKHRISKSEGKESSSSKRKGKKQSLDNTESLRRDSSGAQPAVAATSSSSKVSGSIKAKSKLQELKASPVESVSSSPLRISNADNRASVSKIKVEKDNVEDTHKLATGNPSKFLHGDHEVGRERYGLVRKDAIQSAEPSKNDLQHIVNGGFQHNNGHADNLDPDNEYPSDTRTADRCINEAAGGEAHFKTNVSHSVKSWKSSPSLNKDKKQTFKSTSDKGKVKMSESLDNPPDHALHEEKVKDRKNKVQEMIRTHAVKAETDAICNNQGPSSPKFKAQQEFKEKKPSKKFEVENPENLVSTSSREKSGCLPPSDKERNHDRPHVGNSASASSSDARPSDLPKEPKPQKKADSQNGTHSVPSKHSMSNGRRVKNLDAPSPLRRDASTQAAGHALKEATSLKHHADKLKSAGSPESTGMYFEAVLKFLYSASLWEYGKNENAKHAQAMEIYHSTAMLCEFCAREYERSKDMATAALAYKCMEVAYLRVIYSSHHSASRDHHELQAVMHMVPPGESPSSSASDVDNLNNSASGDKVPLARSGGSPQLATNLTIAARNRPNFTGLLKFANNVNMAMEASRKSRAAFAAANVSMDQGDLKEAISCIKKALDFNFHDVEGLLRLVRIAKEQITKERNDRKGNANN